jgi:hypothetical protein
MPYIRRALRQRLYFLIILTKCDQIDDQRECHACGSFLLIKRHVTILNKYINSHINLHNLNVNRVENFFILFVKIDLHGPKLVDKSNCSLFVCISFQKAMK